MASTKDAVTDFLQLGAKYELILAGLYDDLTRLQGTVDDVEKRNRDSAESVLKASNAVSEMRANVARVQESVEEMGRKVQRQQGMNLVLAVLSVAAVVLSVVA
ncbi:MAG: hypothetical protein ACKORY_00385 [Actinomycetota bacterium]